MTGLSLKPGRHTISILLIALLFAGGISAAQDDTCPAQAETAFSQLALNCASLGRNSACYGSSVVTAVFDPDADAGEGFTQPADRADLLDLQTLQAGAFDLDARTWGIATLNVQGNLPLTVPPPGLVFVMLGDVTLTNGVSPDAALHELAQPLAVTIGAELEIYATPPTGNSAARSLATLPAGSVLQVDGVTPGGQWLRVAQPTGTIPFAWVEAESVWKRQTAPKASGAVVRDLPVIEPGARGPMQTFFLRTGIEMPLCDAAPPSLLYVQVPDGVAADITVNGVSLRVEGAVILRLVPDGGAPSGLALRVFVPSGLTILYAGTDSATLLPPAFAAQAPLEFDQNGRLLISDAFAPNVPASGAELLALQAVEGLPENLLNYPAFIPSVITPSGAGQANPVYAFDAPDQALLQTRQLCAEGALAGEVCDILLAAVGG